MKPSFLITDAESRVVYASSAAPLRAGFDIPEMIGKRPGELWGGLMPKTYYQRFWREIQRNNAHIGNIENRKKSGERYLDRTHIATIRDEDERITFFIELYPSDRSENGYDRFEQAFLAEAGGGNPEGIVRLLNTWMKQEIGERVTTRATLIRCLQERYVSAMRERLGRREDDKALIETAQLDPEAFAELYLKYANAVRGYFMHRVSTAASAEDFTQETFERAFRALPSFRSSNASYLTYLLRIAHNLLVSHYRRGEPEFVEDPATHSLENQIADRASLETALRSLSETDQLVIRLKYIDGLKIHEIAERLRVSQNAVKLRLSRARRKLKTTMEKGG